MMETILIILAKNGSILRTLKITKNLPKFYAQIAFVLQEIRSKQIKLFIVLNTSDRIGELQKLIAPFACCSFEERMARNSVEDCSYMEDIQMNAPNVRKKGKNVKLLIVKLNDFEKKTSKAL